MLGLGTSLGCQPPPAQEPVVFTRTAFIAYDSDDSSAVLNDPAHPFHSFEAALAALVADSPGQPVRVLVQQDIGAVLAGDALEDALLWGLTLGSDDGRTLRTLSGDHFFGYHADAQLTLQHVALHSLTKNAHQSISVESAGTITGIAASIGNLVLDAAPAPYPASNGTDGPDVQGVAGETPGVSGENAVSYATQGGSGPDGYAAWDVRLKGSLSVDTIHATGSDAEAGGNGGNGGRATGGSGYAGGPAIDFTGTGSVLGGQAGGNGGSAFTMGGDGGQGGNGGRGGTVYAQRSVTLGSTDLAGGAGAPGGSGGSAGTAIPGSGAPGGSGANGGDDGASGSDGTATSTPGVSGGDGTPGADGSVQVVA